MSIKSLVAALAFCASMFAVAADPMDSQTAVEPGKWCSDYPSARAYAEANNIPMLVFWANPGCSQCAKLETACKSAEFKAWQAERKIVMVFVYGKETAAQKAAYTWIRNVQKLTAYPFIGVYWNSNASGSTVQAVFTGRTGMMPVKGGDVDTQLMKSVDSLISGWDPSGVKPVDPTPVDPTPAASYTVTFVVDSAKATWTGNLEQQVAAGGSAVAPTVTAKEGWTFIGWDKSFSNVTSSMTVTAKFESTVVVDVRPEAYGKTHTLSALVFDANLDAYAGTASISLGKIGSAETIKVTAKISLFNGKSYSAKQTVTVEKDGSASGILNFKSPVNGMSFALGYDANAKSYVFAAEGASYGIEMVEGKVGGSIAEDELSFSADIGGLEAPDGYDFVTDLPGGEPIYVKNGTKWSFDKAPTVKYKKVDGEYELVIDDGDGAKSNTSALKLSYTSKTGVFSGSFYVYAGNEEKHKLAKYKATVKGVMINGKGYGAVVIKVGKVSYTGSCTID